ncbi:MAG: sugar phosphate isomerase/epimerase [Phycisphaerales bacterium]|nr:sugar phosphate isomerase/epimerase [Phycisphaerales bacterium]
MIRRDRLSLALAALPGLPARQALSWAGESGFRAVQLDVAAPGLRPRDLDRSARRDLAATLRRLELACSGLDLWIPPAHFADASRVERACEAVERACEMADELARLGESARVVSLMLPPSPLAGAPERLGAAAALHGVALADHRHPAAALQIESIAVGIDPASVLAAGGDPLRALAGAGARLIAARLSDLTGAGRASPGLPGGRLDVRAYLATLALAPGVRHITLDLRQVHDAPSAARETLGRLIGNDAEST